MSKNIFSWLSGLVTALSVNYSVHAATIAAPFGLTWGAFPPALTNIKNCRSFRDTFSICKTKSVPRPHKTRGAYWLMFSDKYGLIKVRFKSQNITDDRYGIIGKERFKKIKSQLQQRYRQHPQKEFAIIHREVYRRPEQFYECLKYPGCGYYYLVVGQRNDGAGQIVLKLNGRTAGQGYLTLEYESPEFVSARQQK